ncbi:MAG: hypothetical protein K6F61_07855 [Clostridiales bacterium]|nr:hypothetical protein [Clostridiales bacterium]
MSYFAPYIDDSGLHMPTYEDRLEDLVVSYRSIFGVESELSASVPDYQLLSVFAKALDDVSALCLQAYNSRNPIYATGNALDLLLPQYGIIRAEGETDAEVRARIRNSLAGRGTSVADALLAAVKNARSVKDARLYINETDTTDSIGIPSHSIAVVTRNGNAAAIAQAIFDNKPPGIGTWGSTTRTVTDAAGNEHTISYTPYTDKMIQIYPYITLLAGGDQQAITDAVVPAIVDYVDQIGLGNSLNAPQLYGVVYAANPAISNTFVVTDMQISVPGTSGVVRTVVPCAWNEKITVVRNGGVDIRFS